MTPKYESRQRYNHLQQALGLAILLETELAEQREAWQEGIAMWKDSVEERDKRLLELEGEIEALRNAYESMYDATVELANK